MTTALRCIHHVAIICSDYRKSKKFYTNVLGLKITGENYRKERDSWKLDLRVNGDTQIELFSFPNPPARPSYPEATELRHLAFAVENLEEWINHLQKNNIITEPVQIDEFTEKRFTFFADPDQLPIELYEL